MTDVRVALHIPFLRGGGVERMVLNLAESFLNRGVIVDLVVGERVGGPLASLVPAGIQVVELQARGTWDMAEKLARYLRAMKPKAVLAALTPANLAAIVARRLSGQPTRVVASVHTAVDIARSTTPLRSVVRPLVYRYGLSRADVVVAVSRGVAIGLRKLGVPAEKIRVIYNPIVSAKLDELAKEEVEHPWFADRNVPIILGAGRLHREKDWPTLLHAFACLRKSRMARLVILGEGEERSRLEELIAELNIGADVALLGFQTNPYKFMARADVFVLSSAWEGLGNVIVEALALGRKVVATDCPTGPREILEGGRYGWLVPVGDVRGLATAIATALDSPFDEHMARERSKEFAVDRVAEHYLQVLGVR